MSDRTTSPQWNEAFCFPVQDPKEDILVVKVCCFLLLVILEHLCTQQSKCTSALCAMVLQLSHSWALPIGSLVVPVKQLLSEPELILDQWLHLDGASPESQILLRAELKVLLLIFLFFYPITCTVLSSLLCYSDSFFFTCLSIIHCLIPPFL